MSNRQLIETKSVDHPVYKDFHIEVWAIQHGGKSKYKIKYLLCREGEDIPMPIMSMSVDGVFTENQFSFTANNINPKLIQEKITEHIQNVKRTNVGPTLLDKYTETIKKLKTSNVTEDCVMAAISLVNNYFLIQVIDDIKSEILEELNIIDLQDVMEEAFINKDNTIFESNETFFEYSEELRLLFEDENFKSHYDEYRTIVLRNWKNRYPSIISIFARTHTQELLVKFEE